MTQTLTCLIAALLGAAIEWMWDTAAGWSGGLPLLAWLLYLLSYFAGGWHAASHAVKDLGRGKVNIDLLMIAAACGSASLGHWADGAALLFLFSLSHALESLILGRTRRAISDLMQLTPESAVRIRGDLQEIVPVEELQPGDVVLVHPGERIPADGVLRDGTTSIDESPVNGESIPIDKSPGDSVFSGTLNQQGVVQIEVLRGAGQSTLARMVQLVEEAQSQRADSQQFTDWFGERYSIVVLGLAAVTFFGSQFVKSETLSDSFYRAMTVLVVASPCAVVISIPAAILAAITGAARGGVLVKGGAALEQVARLKGMAFDKTGTLTVGRPRVVTILPALNQTADEVIRLAAALEANSEHPLARAIVAAAGEREHAVTPARDVQAVTGCGVMGTLDGRPMKAGKLTWFADLGMSAREEQIPGLETALSRGETLVGVTSDGTWVGVVGIADTLRPTAKACLSELRSLGLHELVMLTGDAEPVARELGRQLDLSYQAALMPDQKLKSIGQLRERIGAVGMIGDGMNDAPSLAAADVGFSLGGAGTDVALETADVVILADDLRRLPLTIRLARSTQHIIRQNLVIAFGTMLTLLVATLLVRVPLPLAVLGHEGSTVLVILNGLRLLRKTKTTGTFPVDRIDTNLASAPV